MRSNQNRVVEVEEIVDSSTLLDTIAALELMCYEKAEHIRATYQDKALASQWELCARALYRANMTVAKTNL